MDDRYRIETIGANGAVTHERYAATPYAGLASASLGPWVNGVREGTAAAYLHTRDGRGVRSDGCGCG
jgi:hypothetical protein